MTSPRLRRLLDGHEIEALAAPDDEVAGFWRKALRAYRDSRLPGLSPASGFNLAYEAALDTATALVREAGFRVKTSRAHHWATFYALQGLDDTTLARLAQDLDAARTERHENVYEADEDDVLAARRRDALHEVLAELLPAAHARLLAQRPSLKGRIQEPA